MKFPLFAFAVLSFAGVQAQQNPLPVELLTPGIVSVNRMPMRATAFAFESQDLAKIHNKEKSANYLSLNGNDWKFHWVQDPRQRPVDFYKTDFDDNGWAYFKVPANWELNGYGLPIYVNQPYEFTGHAKRGAALHPPFDIPVDNNPVGSYRKKFFLPDNWNGRQIFIHLGAVKSAFFIWVNGRQVGYSEDSKLAAEFDITQYLKKGENLLALQVYRWSDGSYLECQDMWRISGIERDVYLYSTPQLDIRDFKVTADLTDNYKNGLLSIKAEIRNYKTDRNTYHSVPDTFALQAALFDASGKEVFNTSFPGIHSALGNYETELHLTEKIAEVQSWTAETPYLYTLYLTLKNNKDSVMEVVPVRVGFRSISIQDGNFLVNGKRILLKGVNRHEHNAKEGHTLTRDDMLKDMEMMKKLNVNAVRNSHYPPDPYWMELCDEYGLYVVDEANIESHGIGYDLEYTLGNKTEWKEAHMQRVIRMYERDKNHPSIVTWSLGNEAGNGSNFYTAYDWLKNADVRPVQYERAEWDYNTDMIVPQYPSPSWLKRYADGSATRPLIMSEYAHIMGNSLGNFKDYWNVIEANPKLQGGFVWEWIDQTFDTVKNGKRIMAYGGDFPLQGPVDENLSDNNFCVKGVVTAYRELTPMAIELKKVYQHIKSDFSDNTLSVHNGYFFKDLGDLQLDWEVVEDGKPIRSGSIARLEVLPQTTSRIAMPVNVIFQPGKEYFLNVYFKTRANQPFLPKGYTVAYDQFALSAVPHGSRLHAAKPGKVATRQAGNIFHVDGKNFSTVFDLSSGLMTGFSAHGVKLLEQGPQPSFWRAPTDNDIGAGFNKSLRMWRKAYETGVLLSARAGEKPDGSVVVSFKKSLVDGDAEVTQTFTIHADGTILVDNHVQPLKGKHPLFLRVGNDLQVNKSLQQVKWYGRGPWESYWDRKTASIVGRYEQPLQEQYFKYVRPQESGNKSDVRWYSLTDSKGRGIRIVYADSLLNCSAIQYNIDDLDPAPEKHQFHSGELTPRDTTFMHVDLQQTGLQGMDSWGSWPLPPYRIPYADQRYSYWMIPVK